MADVRFNRIAVSIFDTYPLAWYFQNMDRMMKATIYLNIYEQWKITSYKDIFSVSKFLEILFKEDPSKFISLFSYIIDDLPNHYYTIYPRHPAGLKPYHGMADRKRILMNQLSWFFRELETIGVTWDVNKFHLAVGTTELDIEIKSRLESMLSDLGEAYLNRYLGAVEALMSESPDRLSQSISSMRELLREILHLLTKDDEFSKDEKERGRPTRRARIKHILARSKGLGAEAELSDSIANTLVKTYCTLNKGFHVTDKKDWENILYVFKSTEYLIYYILKQR